MPFDFLQELCTRRPRKVGTIQISEICAGGVRRFSHVLALLDPAGDKTEENAVARGYQHSSVGLGYVKQAAERPSPAKPHVSAPSNHNFLHFFAGDDHRVSHRFFVHEWKGKRHVVVELLQARNIGTTLSQDLAHFFWRFEKVVVPE
jgi:hypothetical protein